MPDDEMTPEQRQAFADMGVNPDEFAEYERNQMAWDVAEEMNIEAGTVVLARKAKESLGDLKINAPSFFQTADDRLASHASEAINKMAHKGCEAMCQAALKGNAKAAGQLARLAVMLTEALADTVEKGRADANFSEAMKAIREVAHWLPYWPVFFYTGSEAEERELLDVFEDLELGQGCPIQLIRRSGQGRKKSLSTPINRLIWSTMAEMYKIRYRAEEFRRKQAAASMVLGRNEESTSFHEHLRATLEPGALLVFAAERTLDETETKIIARMLELEEISEANARIWADEVVFPYIWKSCPNPEVHSAFENISKRSQSGGDFPARAAQAVRRALLRLCPK